MIRVQDVSFRYPEMRREALVGVTLDLTPGSCVAIIGSNGSGKSTLARCMNGLLIPTRGQILVDGLRTDSPTDLIDIRRKIGLVFQDPSAQMVSMTVERELAFGLENLGVQESVMKALVREQLERCELTHLKERVPSDLSAGEQQRVAVASVLLRRPCYLILDEATSLLSPIMRGRLLSSLFPLLKEHNGALLLVTQFASEALLADRLIVLHQGSILLDDVPKKVFCEYKVLDQLGVPVPKRFQLTSSL